MRLFVATFRRCDDEPDIYLATTIEKAKEILAECMRDHLKYIGHDNDGEEIPDDYSALESLGWNEEYYYVDINSHKVHSDGHILKYVMEQI